jgi:hypothetical protein
MSNLNQDLKRVFWTRLGLFEETISGENIKIGENMRFTEQSELSDS